MKSLSTLSAHCQAAIAAGATRRSVVVAFGGGVPGNLAGLTAAMLYRGIRLVHIPTTTVSAMDSVISLKQAINSDCGKNHLGTYYLPQAVYTDVSLLSTLPLRELRSGMGEAMKNCLAIRPQSIADLRQVLRSDLAAPQSLLWLLEESLTAKAEVTRDDAKEQKAGLVLEYGHTIGHAVEICDQRVRGSEGIAHGAAVALGMLAAARIARKFTGLSPQTMALHDELVQALGTPTTIPAGIARDEVMQVVRSDNKRGYLPLRSDEAAMVLLADLGEPAGSRDCPLVAVPLDLVEQAISDLAEDANG